MHVLADVARFTQIKWLAGFYIKLLNFPCMYTKKEHRIIITILRKYAFFCFTIYTGIFTVDRFILVGAFIEFGRSVQWVFLFR